MKIGSSFRFWCVLASAGWALTLAAAAQIEPVPEMPLTMDGAVSFGYAGGGGGTAAGGSGSNSVNVGVNANLDGYYHDPRFLSFDAAPRFTWNRFGESNAAADSLRNDGITSNLRFLSSSNAPLSFAYDLSSVNSATLTGGTTPLTVSASGLSKDYSVNWAPHFARFPSLSVTYAWGSAESSAGPGDDFLNSHSGLNLLSIYKVLGFYMTGTYTRTENESRSPDLLNLGLPKNVGQSNQQAEGFGVNRAFTSLRSDFGFNYEHSDSEFSVTGTPQSESFRTESAAFSSNPVSRLQLGFGASHTSNYGAQLLTEMLAPGSGGTTTAASSQPQSFIGMGEATSYDATANYQIGHGFNLMAVGQQQTSGQPGGEQFVLDQTSAGLYYGHTLFRGTFSASYMPGMEELRYNLGDEIWSGGGPTQSNHRHRHLQESWSARFLTQAGSAAYQRRFGRWQTQEAFQYSHSNFAEALAIPMMVESVGGSARIGTRLSYHYNLSIGGSLSDQRVPGMNNSFNREIDTQLSTRSWSATGQYSQNSGYVLLTTAGIVGVSSVAASTGIVPAQYTDSKAISGSGSYTRRRLQLTGTYSWVDVNFTSTVPVTSRDSTLDARLIYKFRKVDVQAGFRRLSQYASSNAGLSMASHTYWISLVRRFHAF